VRVVLLLAVAGTGQRGRLLADGLPRLDEHGVHRWQFTDLQSGLVELVVDGDGHTSLDGWLEDVARAGAIEGAQRVAAPFSLAPALFPGGRPPAGYEDLNARASARACALARHAEVAPPAVCAVELAGLYAALADDPRRTARWHLAWIGVPSSEADGPVADTPDDGVGNEAVPWCTRAEAAELAADAARLDQLGPDVPFGGRVLDATTARLAHVQFVRLRAVEDQRLEVALLRRLVTLPRPG
jgi:hypothetical protein